jgi:hypothetical protein
MTENGMLVLYDGNAEVFRGSLSGDGGNGVPGPEPGAYRMAIEGVGEAAIVDPSFLSVPHDASRALEFDVEDAYAFSLTGQNRNRLCVQSTQPASVGVRDFEFIEVASGQANPLFDAAIEEGEGYPRDHRLDFVTIFLRVDRPAHVTVKWNAEDCIPAGTDRGREVDRGTPLPFYPLAAALLLAAYVARRRNIREGENAG